MGDPAVYDPLELLTNKGTRQPTFLSPIWNPMAAAIAGFGAALFINWGFRKPALAGKFAMHDCDVTLLFYVLNNNLF